MNFFWTKLAYRFVKIKDLKNPKAKVEIWIDLLLIEAVDPKNAVAKAEDLGQLTADRGSIGLEIGNLPAKMQFVGIVDMGLVHDEVGDGAEICWEKRRSTIATSNQLKKERAELMADLKREFSPRKNSKKSK